ncbi:MAG: hypothetical protein UY95_C0002G0002 [Parcubacteria group bacterium GW2011_GWA2_56_7]|nr:MAG: hypothetical protein UY95_C0002G0002 [Parcubacteria group bacterium GW2011_GWA2_56_7]
MTCDATPLPGLPVEQFPNYFTPAYGFGDDKDAAISYLTRVNKDAAFGQLELIESGGGKFYVTRPWIESFDLKYAGSRRYGSRCFVHIVSRGAIATGESGEAWTTLRTTDQPLPAGAHNVILVSSGPRRFKSWGYRTDAGVEKTVNSGVRDLYAHWARQDGSPIQRSVKQTEHGQAIFAVQSGCGAIYARPWSYSRFHGMNPPMDKVLLVRFQIYNRDPEQDDVVRLNVTTIHLYEAADGSLRPDERDEVDLRWKPIVTAALRGYREHCRDIAPELQALIDPAERGRMRRELDRELDRRYRSW